MILKIAQQLIENEYVPIIKNTGSNIFCGGKQIGPCLYCVIAVNADMPDYKQRFEQMAGYLGGSYSVQNFNLIILGIFAADNITEELREYATVDAEIFEKVNILKWVLTPNGVEIFGKQPTKLADLRTIAENAVNADTTPQSLDDIIINNENKRRERIVSKDSVFTFIMLALIGVVFAAQIFDADGAMLDAFCTLPFAEGQYYRYLTAIFLHLGFTHFISNCLGLYLFGTRTERYFGKANFLMIFFAGGILANLTSSLFGTSGVGASGAIMALMGAVTAYSFGTKRSVDGFDMHLLVLFLLINLVVGGLYEGIDNIAHIAGFIYGYVLGMLKTPRKS